MKNINDFTIIQNNECDWYKIPNNLLKDFIELNDTINSIEYLDNPDAFEEFECKFNQFRTGGDMNNPPDN